MAHVVALSGGKDSTAMALRLAEIEPRDYEYVCTPTGNELPPMVAHWQILEELLGKPIRRVSNGETLLGASIRQKCLPNHRMRWCTRILKIEPYQAWLMDKMPCVSYVGIRADEVEQRTGAILSGDVETRYPLVDWGWGLRDVLEYLECRGVEIPDRTDCALCFYQTLAEWWHLWADYPTEFEKGETIEAAVGHTLRSDKRDSQPAALKALRKKFEKGYVPRGTRLQLELWRGMDDRKAMCSICAR